MQGNKNIYAIGATLAIVTLSACSMLVRTPEAQLARCLEDKGVKMYGTTWCPQCIRQRDAFKEGWEFTPFIDCVQDKAACAHARIKEYPTWFFPEGNISRKGYLRLDMLAAFSACPYTGDVRADKIVKD